MFIFAQNTDCWYTLEPPRRDGSNEYPQSMFWSKNKTNRYTTTNPSFSIQKYNVGYNVGLKTLLSEGLSEPEFYGDLVYKFKKLKGINDFSFQFRKIITRYRL